MTKTKQCLTEKLSEKKPQISHSNSHSQVQNAMREERPDLASAMECTLNNDYSSI